MIDFSKKMSSVKKTKIIEPMQLYESLDSMSEAGPLRPAQIEVLSDWNENYRNKNDFILKLPTGSGKTLTGLLISLSYMYENNMPSIYVCPNIYLMQQTCEEARKFGIPFCIIPDNNILPDDFLNSKKVLITYVQKVFNGLSIFGIDRSEVNIGSILLDDSHACIDSIAATCTIVIDNNNSAYDALLKLFEADLSEQGQGSLQDIKGNTHNSTIMNIPYWAWIDNSNEVTKILSQVSENKNIKFAWPLLKDIIPMCNAYISSDRIEISPECVPINKFTAFSKAKHRILMSATTQEDSFFIKGLNLSKDAVENPIVDKEYLWTGEKMIVIPSLLNLNVNDDELIAKILKLPHDRAGIVVLTPSFIKSEKYTEQGCILGNSPQTNIYETIKKYKSDNYKKEVIVFANRYDGIDMPDDTCRILIIDSLPYYDSLRDRYEEVCREESEIIKIKTAQKIEQGLGRSVRGIKDYSVIIITGNDLVRFMQTSLNKQYFSLQTQKQIEIGFDMSEDESSENTTLDFINLINQCLLRGEAWKDYYVHEMNKIKVENSEHNNMHNIFTKEKQAYNEFIMRNYVAAKEIIQEIVNEVTSDDEKGWYLQILAKYTYLLSKTESELLQQKAFKYNSQLLKPKTGISYSKIKYEVNDNRIKMIKDMLRKFSCTSDFKLEIDNLLSNLKFGTNSTKFEYTIEKIGALIGFKSQRPDKEIRKGPDNIWCTCENKYILLECKSEINLSRKDISKGEAGQMEEHCAWFETEYKRQADYNVLIIPTNIMAYDAYFSHDVKILTVDKLNQFRDDLKKYFSEYYCYDITSLTEDKIKSFLFTHGFMKEDFIKKYLVDFKAYANKM